MLKRYLQDQVIQDLKKKMVFISGPRQVGKTTLARSIILLIPLKARPANQIIPEQNI